MRMLTTLKYLYDNGNDYLTEVREPVIPNASEAPLALSGPFGDISAANHAYRSGAVPSLHARPITLSQSKFLYETGYPCITDLEEHVSHVEDESMKVMYKRQKTIKIKSDALPSRTDIDAACDEMVDMLIMSF